MIGGSEIRAQDYSIMGSRIHIGLKQEINGISLNYKKTLAFQKVVTPCLLQKKVLVIKSN
jgi:hypothetical protein